MFTWRLVVTGYNSWRIHPQLSSWSIVDSALSTGMLEDEELELVLG